MFNFTNYNEIMGREDTTKLKVFIAIDLQFTNMRYTVWIQK